MSDRTFTCGRCGQEKAVAKPGDRIRLTEEQALMLFPKGLPAGDYYICLDCTSGLIASFKRANDQVRDIFKEMAAAISAWLEGVDIANIEWDVKEEGPPLCDCGAPFRIYHAGEGTSGYYCPGCDGGEEEANADSSP